LTDPVKARRFAESIVARFGGQEVMGVDGEMHAVPDNAEAVMADEALMGQFVPTATFEVVSGEQRTRLDADGIVTLAEGTGDLTEELWHAAIDLALNDAQKAALRRQYGTDDAAIQAYLNKPSREAQTLGERILRRVREIFQRIAAGLRGQVTAAQVFKDFETGRLWQQEQAPQTERGDFAVRPIAEQAAPRIQAGEQVRGRPELANPAEMAEARQAVDVVDTVRAEQGQPERKADAELYSQVDTYMSDPGGAREDIVATARGGGQLNDVQTIAAKRLVSQEATAAVQSGNLERITQAAELVNVYRRSGTEQARAFRARFDPAMTPQQRLQAAVGEALVTPTRKTARQLGKVEGEIEKARTDKRREALERTRDALLKRQAREIQHLRRQLERAGIDLTNLDQELADPDRAAHVIREVSAHKADWWDALHEYWLVSILSGPTTQAANIVGNTASTAWDFTFQRVAEAMVNTVARDPASAQWGEFKYILRGMGPGFRRAVRSTVGAWRTEQAVFEDEVRGTQTKRIETMKGSAIGGRKGRVLRMPFRALLAMDEAFKSLIAEMEVGAQAYRMAKAEGLSGEDLARRIEALLGDYESPAWQEAVEKAVYLTFQKQLGAAGSAVMRTRDDVPGLRYTFPFVRTPANIFKMGLRKTPLGALSATKAALTDPTYSRQNVVRDAAEQLLAVATTVGLMSALGMMGDDDDEPRITGSSPYQGTKRGERELAYRNAPPQSIRLGDRWYSYARIEPMATTLATMVDMLNTVQRAKNGQDMAKTISDFYVYFLAQLKDKTFTRGLGDMMNAIEDPRSAARWATTFASSWVPNIIRQPARALDPMIRETGVWGKDAEWGLRMMHRLQYRAFPIPGNAPPARVDLWGRDVKAPEGKTAYTDVLWRMLSPVRSYDTTDRSALEQNLDRMILNYNNAHPNDTWAPQRPQPYFTQRGKTYYWSDEEYQKLSRLAGQTAIDRLSRGRYRHLNFDEPTERDRDAVDSELKKARAYAKIKMLRSRK